MTEKEFEKLTEVIQKTARRIANEGKRAAKQPYKMTERRLRAYPILKENIKRYKMDIDDIRHEDMGKSADIIMFQANSGMSPERDLEELRQEKIFGLTEKIYRDTKEIEEIDVALQSVKANPYYQIIPLTYFEGKQQEAVAQAMHCDKTTVWRNRQKLVTQMSVVLYGADAI